jgi:hypothetical protein
MVLVLCGELHEGPREHDDGEHRQCATTSADIAPEATPILPIGQCERLLPPIQVTIASSRRAAQGDTTGAHRYLYGEATACSTVAANPSAQVSTA